MRNFFSYLTLLAFMTSAMGATSPQIIPNDSVQIGKSAAGDKTIILNNNAGSANPKIKWNNSTSKLQFANDGATFKNMGSGSGGGSGISLIGENNPGFEEGTTKWTNSGGGATFSTSGTTPGYELLSGVFNSSATSQTLTSDAVSLPSGLQGSACIASIWYKTTEATNKYKLQVYDGSTVLSESTLEATSGWDKTNGYAGFNCPSSGTVSMRIISTGDGADISLDQAYLGEAKTIQLSQAQFMGSLKYANAASCDWPTTSGSFANFAADTDCSTPTVTGSVTAPGTKIPGFVLSNLPAGEYLVLASGSVYYDAGSALGVQLHDGTNGSGAGYYTSTTTANMINGISLMGRFSYSSAQSSVTIQIQGARLSGAGTVQLTDSATGKDLEFKVYRYPSVSDTVVRADNLGWYIDTNIRGADIALGTSAQSQALLADGSLTLGICDQTGSNCTSGINSGSAAAMIACSGTNAASGNTCSAGNEHEGLVFSVPQAGTYEVCTAFTYQGSYGNASATPKFDLIETSPTNDATVISYGRGARQSSALTQNLNNNNGDQWNAPVGSCYTFNFTSAGQKAVRMIYTQNAWTSGYGSNALLGSSFFSTKWTVKPLGLLGGIPVAFKGLVTSNTSGKERIERVSVNTSCTSSPCTIGSQSGSWVSSITRASAGNYTVNFVAASFSAAPICWAISSNNGITSASTPTTSSWNFISVVSAGTPTDGTFMVGCMGPN